MNVFRVYFNYTGYITTSYFLKLLITLYNLIDSFMHL